MNEQWRDVFGERYTPMVRGTPREWRGRVKDDMIFNWGNLVIFVPTESEAVQEMETDDEGDEESDEVAGDEEPRPANPEA